MKLPRWTAAYPVIAMVPAWEADVRKHETKGGRVNGCCSADGFLIRFHAGRFAEMSDAEAAWVVGHELAHVPQFLCNYDGSVPFPANWTREMIEDDANERMKAWGFVA